MMSLASMLAGPRGGVFLVAPDVTAAEVERQAAAAGLHYARVDLSRARSREALLRALGKALRFPAWYGQNWDALADCLADLSWLPAQGWVLLLDDAAEASGTAGGRGPLATAVELLREAAGSWAEEGRPFVALVRGRGRPGPAGRKASDRKR